MVVLVVFLRSRFLRYCCFVGVGVGVGAGGGVTAMDIAVFSVAAFGLYILCVPAVC